MKYQVEELAYDFDALEPFLDQKTMEIHHDKHYAGYVEKLNAALVDYPDLSDKSLDDLLSDLSAVPEAVRMAVKNSGGGVLNHAMFWKLLKKDSMINGEIAQAINDKFGGFEEFKKQFSEASVKLFGSGWAWLVVEAGELKIITTANQDSPLSLGLKPILGLDLWEHAYYLKYQNRRPEYIEAFFSVINWEQVNEYYKNNK